MARLITSRDYDRAEELADLRRNAKTDDAARQVQADAAFVQANPQIGQLIRRGKPVYYVNAPTYTEASNPRELVQA
jgi:hypothetical protein